MSSGRPPESVGVARMKIFVAVSLILAFGTATAANAQSCRIGSGPDLGDGFPYCSEFPPVVLVGGGYGYARQALRDAGWQPQPTADCASNMGWILKDCARG